jgi:uncharacterized membrane protein YedE/YeeE
MQEFTPISSLVGGALIGLSASILLFTHGRIAGISGLYGGIFRRATPDRMLRIAFIAGLLFSGFAVRWIFPAAFDASIGATLPVALAAGLLVGFGTQLANGCTSGHGVCGISRLSMRSMVATATFMIAGIATTWIARHAMGVGR